MTLHLYKVYVRIKEDIILGSCDLGEQLSVDDLATKYSVNKTPMKEALNLLQVEGLIEIVPRVGYFTIRQTFKHLQDVFELRIILESNAVAPAATRISPDEKSIYRRQVSSQGCGQAPRRTSPSASRIDLYWLADHHQYTDCQRRVLQNGNP